MPMRMTAEVNSILFVRSLDAAKESLKNSKDKTLILPADSAIARIFTGK